MDQIPEETFMFTATSKPCTITIVNQTGYNWNRTYDHCYQMMVWREGFPVRFLAQTRLVCDVSEKLQTGSYQVDNAGDLEYTIDDGTTNKPVIHLLYKNYGHWYIKLMNFSASNLVREQYLQISKGTVVDGYEDYQIILKCDDKKNYIVETFK